MNPELRKLLDEINAKKKEVKNLVTENKVVEAQAAKEELKTLQAKFDVLYDLEDEELEGAKGGQAKPIENNKRTILTAFVNAIKAGIKKTPVDSEDMQLLNAMTEGTAADGGLTVPQDISTKIKELRRSTDALELLVNVETVSTLAGSRIIEKQADQTPFDNVDEAAQFPDVSTPQFEKISYTIKKKGGILKVSRELLEDTAENVLAYLKKWIAKKAKATRNALIIAQINTITTGKEVAVADIDDLKEIFNKKLDPAISANGKVVTNQSGFDILDKLKDLTGKYILQPDPTQPTAMKLFGKYPVMMVSDKVLPNTTVGEVTKAPIICGDLSEAITLFDREQLSIDMSTEAGDLWGKDQTGIKVRERLDIQTVDAAAIIKGEITIS